MVSRRGSPLGLALANIFYVILRRAGWLIVSRDRPFGLDTWMTLSPHSTVKTPLPDI